jgi:two-component system cell cycle sensor histidine kinase/response regulator CckA
MSGPPDQSARRFARVAGAVVAVTCLVGVVRSLAGAASHVPFAGASRLAGLLCGLAIFLTARDANAANPWPGRAAALAALATAGLSDLAAVPRAGIAAAALSLLVRDIPGVRRAGEFLAGVTGLSGLALLLGWLFAAPTFQHDAPSQRAALSVSLALFTICSGLLALYPARGVVPFLTSTSAGGALVRRILVPAVVIAIALGWARLQLARIGSVPFESTQVWLVVSGVAIVGVLVVWTGRYLDGVERERRAADRRFEELFENARDAIYVHDLKGRYLAVNRATELLVGYSRAELLEMEISDVLAPESAQRAAVLLAETRGEIPPAMPGDDGLVEFEVRRKDGRHVPIEVNVRVIEEEGRPTRIEGIARDVSERRFLEEQVRQVQRLDAVGRLAGGVAHDLSSHLTTILCYVRPMVERLSARDKMRSDLEQVEAAAGSAANLVQQLLAFGRRGVQQRRSLDLNGVIAPLARLLGHQLGEGIETKIALAADLRPVRADPTQMEQVTMNLALNARDAMPHGGVLSLETVNVDLDAEAAARLRDLAPGRYVLLAVRDTGTGMDRETQDRIFEPFFTTKELGKGTGLGLATVYGIVKQSGGDIAVQSAPGRGTAMLIYLPCSEGPA